MESRTYIAIDLKSFYASVECVERGLDPLTTHLVVADESRTDKTICLAVTPALKSHGVKGRPRLFEVKSEVKKINEARLRNCRKRTFDGESYHELELQRNPNLKLSFICAKPRMAKYMEISTQIYQIYLQYIAPEDIHVYSIDEVFIDATDYLKLYQKDAYTFTRDLIREVLRKTKITATGGIGTNLFLCKCAMDIVAKHIPGDADGVRICALNEEQFRKQLWRHKPLTDFWRVGKGIAKKLEQEGIETMGDVARCSIGGFYDYYNEDLLYRMFGVNAELLIDHAWGYEATTMKDIKAYKPAAHSIGIGQVLSRPYSQEEGLVVLKEMGEDLALRLQSKKLVALSLALTIHFDQEGMEQSNREVAIDFYGRMVPKPLSTIVHLSKPNALASSFKEAFAKQYLCVTNKNDYIRKLQVSAIDVRNQDIMVVQQTSLFETTTKDTREEDEKEKKAQEAILFLQQKYGKNSVLKAVDKKKEATTEERNNQIGGHHA